MKITWSCIVFLISFYVGYAQTDSVSGKWDFSSDLNAYLIPHNTTLPDFILLPVVRADKNKLHLEARYNYEDINTFSAWGGYNFNGGKNFEYAFTTMVGGVIGEVNGIAPGLEISLSYKKFELYDEMEYLFDFNDRSNDFYYNWAELSYSITDWLKTGITTQRTRLYETGFAFQKGLILGLSYNNWKLTSYFYNIGTKFDYYIITLTGDF